jgi:hypothetical protein
MTTICRWWKEESMRELTSLPGSYILCYYVVIIGACSLQLEPPPQPNKLVSWLS